MAIVTMAMTVLMTAGATVPTMTSHGDEDGDDDDDDDGFMYG